MELNVFVKDEVKKIFENFVLLQLYTDDGPRKDEYRKMQEEIYGTVALPFYVIIDDEENEISRFHGMDTNINKFIKFLNSGIKQS